MTILSLADSCRLLAIDAKTLRHWLRLAHISVQAHPFDARLKCVTSEHVQHLAATHRRTLPESSEQLFPAAPSTPSISSDVSAVSVCSSMMSDATGPIMRLTQQIGSLQAQIALLQQQLALLTQHVQKEQQERTNVIKTVENKSAESSLDKSAESSLDKPAESSLDKPAESSLDNKSVPASIDRRKHPRVLPLVEYPTGYATRWYNGGQEGINHRETGKNGRNVSF